jgi:myo-inositol-1(or 4)-monophosphatase
VTAFIPPDAHRPGVPQASPSGGLTDRELAEAAAWRAGDLLRERFGAEHAVERKSASGADVVTEADRAAEAAVIELLRVERPGDGVLGEEGARREGARTWLVDALDGTFNYVAGVPHWCSAVALLEEGFPLASAVCDPLAGESYSAARGGGAGRLAVRTGRPLDEAIVSTFADRRVLDDRALVALARAVGVLRTGGAGSLDLAWVAAGRLDAWIQRNPEPWDWWPGALLVIEAGGAAVVRGDGWHIVGAPDLVEELLELELS